MQIIRLCISLGKLTVLVLLAACASAQAQRHLYLNCPALPSEPLPQLQDGDGDNNAKDFLMHPRIVFRNTVLEVWCIDGGPDGHYIALKVDGQPGQNFKLIGKCAWDKGQNDYDYGGVSSNRMNLTRKVIFISRDPRTKNYWKYTYHPELGSIVAEKFDRNNKLIRAETFIAKSQPFKYSDLPGGSDPTRCVETRNLVRTILKRRK